MSEKRFNIKPQDDYWAVVDAYNEDKVCIINGIHTEIEAIWLCALLNDQQSIIDEQKIAIDEMINDYKNLEKENNQLRQMIKENVFGMYEEGSLTDLEFKAIAYDDIVKLKISDESEPKVVVICKQGKKENVKSFCQMFIPFGIAYEIVEMIDDE